MTEDIIYVDIIDEEEVVEASASDNSGGVSKHSELDLDDGTNPHDTTLADVDDGFIAKTNEENNYSKHQTITDKRLLLKGGIGRAEIYANTQNMSMEYYVNDIFVRSLVFNQNGFFPDTPLDLGFDFPNSKWKDLFLSGYANVLGVKSATNDASKVFATDGSEVDAYGSVPS